MIDAFLDTATFLYIGAIIPCAARASVAVGSFMRAHRPSHSAGSEFSTEYLKPWKLVLFAICILVFRRLPAMLVFYRTIPAVDGVKQALFTGWCAAAGHQA